MAAWLAMCLAGLLEYTWGALNPFAGSGASLGPGPGVLGVLLLRHLRVIRPDRSPGTCATAGSSTSGGPTIIGGIVCGVIGYGILAESTSIWEAYIGYAVLGGIGSGMVYSSCINIVAKWYPEKKGWRTGFVNGGWAYGAVPFILVIGGFSSGGGVGVHEPELPEDLHLGAGASS